MRRNERKISDIQEIEEIISKADVCRIALANANDPYIVCMNFGYTKVPDRHLFFHCASKGRKLEMLRNNNYVCFEMDTDHQIYTGINGCDWGMKFRSVVGFGTISTVTDNDLKRVALNSIMKHYGGDVEFSYDEKVFDRTTILRLDIEEMTGKKC